jgi:hypothetical protein
MSKFDYYINDGRTPGAPFLCLTSCGRESWWPSGRQAPRLSSRPILMQSL